jgi:hypothetical protein
MYPSYLKNSSFNQRSEACVLLSLLVSIATAQIHNGEKHFFTYPSKCARWVVSAIVGIRWRLTWNNEVQLLNDSNSFIHFSPTSFCTVHSRLVLTLDNAWQIPQSRAFATCTNSCALGIKSRITCELCSRFNPKISKSHMYIHSFLRFQQYAEGVPFTALSWSNVVNKRQLQSPPIKSWSTWPFTHSAISSYKQFFNNFKLYSAQTFGIFLPNSNHQFSIHSK